MFRIENCTNLEQEYIVEVEDFHKNFAEFISLTVAYDLIDLFARGKSLFSHEILGYEK